MVFRPLHKSHNLKRFADPTSFIFFFFAIALIAAISLPSTKYDELSLYFYSLSGSTKNMGGGGGKSAHGTEVRMKSERRDSAFFFSRVSRFSRFSGVKPLFCRRDRGYFFFREAGKRFWGNLFWRIPPPPPLGFSCPPFGYEGRVMFWNFVKSPSSEQNGI
jgi:hypothetical protein